MKSAALSLSLRLAFLLANMRAIAMLNARPRSLQLDDGKTGVGSSVVLLLGVLASSVFAILI